MPLADYAAFLPSLGWLAALAFAALLPSLPEATGRRHAGWLIAFCAARLLLSAATLAQPSEAGGWQQIGSILAASLLWEFARRLWNDSAGRRMPATTHLVAAECLVLFGATALAVGEGSRFPSAPFLAVDLLLALLPMLLAGGATCVLWRQPADADPRRTLAWRIAALGFLLHPLAGATPLLRGGAEIAPWLVVAGLGAIAWTVSTLRTTANYAWIGGLFFVSALGPPAVATSVRQIERERDMELIAQARHVANRVQGRFAALAADTPLSPEARRGVVEQLDRVQGGDALLHAATVWKLRDGQRVALDLSGETARFAAGRPPTADESAHAADIRPFLSRVQGDRTLVTVQVPLRRGPYDSPDAWLALDYPEAFWAVQREHARRTGAVLIGVCAAFCAMGFVLSGRQAIENAQRLAIERAESADRAKTEFLAFLSHEMRTPLQTILGRTELLRQESVAPRHADAIETQGRHLLRLVTDLLDLGTIEAGKLKLHSAPFALRALLASLEETHGPAAAEKDLTLDVTVEPEVADRLLGDEARLRQILGNLLGNAVKYTARGTVTLHVTTPSSSSGPGPQLSNLNSQLLQFAVTDTGPGLPPAKIPQLFTLFTRLDAGGTFTREGTGVGLALVRRLCDLMGGTVTAANRPEGGAEFQVRLAFPRAEPSIASAPPAQPPRRAAQRILIAEDNAATREYLVEAIVALGHEVVAVSDGLAATAACDAQPFDSVLLDINLPGRDGIALAHLLAKRPRRPRLIACSAEAFAATREAALAAGIDVFLEKPVTLGALAAALQPDLAPDATPGGNVFERLRAPQLTAEARVTLARELPDAVAQLRAAAGAGDTVALQRCAHRLRSTALLARDDRVAELCRQLETPASQPGATDTTALIAALADCAIA